MSLRRQSQLFFVVRITTLLIFRRKSVEELIEEALETLDTEGKCCDILNCICNGDNPTCAFEGSNGEPDSESDEGFQD